MIKKRPKGINWHTAIFMGLLHGGAVAALFVFSWQALLAAILLWWISASLGVGMGFHRLLTHRGYKTPRWVEYFLTVCGTLALEGGPINWVVTHRIHHANADAPGDPHTPRDGGLPEQLVGGPAYLGEGWQNNHHAHPTAARHGLAWYEIDINWWGIRVMQILGLARTIKLVSAPQRFLT